MNENVKLKLQMFNGREILPGDDLVRMLAVVVDKRAVGRTSYRDKQKFWN